MEASGTVTYILAFGLKKEVRAEDLWPLFPKFMNFVLQDPQIVYPSSGLQNDRQKNLMFAIGNEGRSHATVRFQTSPMLSVDVKHECDSVQDFHPLTGPHTSFIVHKRESEIQELLGDWCVKCLSLYSPIRLRAEGPRAYTELGNDRLVETDYLRTVHEVVSPYQTVTINKSWQFGNVLLLDEDIMLGESDEIYTQTVLGLNRGNKFGGTKVLILGGGDGGLLNTLVSLPEPPAHVIMAELDEEVIKACRTHMRSVCGDVFDTYKTPQYTIVIKDCIQVMKDFIEKGEKFDYVVNDLTELMIKKEEYGFVLDFKTNNIMMELSFHCLKEGGTYLARGNASSCSIFVKQTVEELEKLGYPFQKIEMHVPSFQELYCFFEAKKTKK